MFQDIHPWNLAAYSDQRTRTNMTAQTISRLVQVLTGSSHTEVLAFESTTTGTNGALSQDTDSDGIGDGTQLTSTLQTFTSSISGTGTTLLLKLRLVSTLRRGFCVDDFSVTGTAASGDCAAGQHSTDGQSPALPAEGTFQPYTGKSWCTTSWGGQYATGTQHRTERLFGRRVLLERRVRMHSLRAGKYQPDGAKSWCNPAEGGQYAPERATPAERLRRRTVLGDLGARPHALPAQKALSSPTRASRGTTAWGGQYATGTGNTAQSACAEHLLPSSGGASSCTPVPADNYQDQAGMSWYTLAQERAPAARQVPTRLPTAHRTNALQPNLFLLGRFLAVYEKSRPTVDPDDNLHCRNWNRHH